MHPGSICDQCLQRCYVWLSTQQPSASLCIVEGLCCWARHARRKLNDLPTWACRITARLHVLPLVSKRWARIMKTSTVVWQQTCMDTADILKQGYDERFGFSNFDLGAMALWFQARPGRFIDLGLRASHSATQLPPALTPMLLSTQAGSLRCLSIDLTACGFLGHELGILAVIDGLMELDVRLVGRGLDDRGAAIFRAASTLTALQQLEVGYTAGRDGSDSVPQRQVSLPRCCELSKLRSQRLQFLGVALSSSAEDLHVLCLTGVPNLEECLLSGDRRANALFPIDLTSFANCARLEDLTVQHQWGLSLEPGCFQALSALTSLALTDCSLTSVPDAIAPLTRLQVLNLSQHKYLDVAEAEMNMLRELKQLRALDLAKPKRVVHTASSMQAVINLVEACRGAGQLLHVNVDPDMSDICEA